MKKVKDLNRGDVVRALKDLDPEGAAVPEFSIGVVFEEENAYEDGAGPMVRWIFQDEDGGACNVYEGDVEEVQ